ncbi:MAG: hypothetical protein R2748_31240 [Bryobacterales bacterium]
MSELANPFGSTEQGLADLGGLLRSAGDVREQVQHAKAEQPAGLARIHGESGLVGVQDDAALVRNDDGVTDVLERAGLHLDQLVLFALLGYVRRASEQAHDLAVLVAHWRKRNCA